MTAFRYARRTTRIGRRLYVAPAPTGNDSTGTGTRTNPYATIAKAATVVTAGTTVFVAPGTYSNVYMLTDAGGGTASNPVWYVSSVRWGALVRSTITDSAWYIGDEGTTNFPEHIRVLGFEITAPNARHGIKADSNDVWIMGCHVHNVCTTATSDFAGAGLNLQGYINDGAGAGYKGTGNRAIGNWVHDVGHINNKLAHPIYVGCPQSVVANNVCYDSGGWGIHCYHGPNGSSVINNTVFDCNGTVENGGILFGGGEPGEPITTSGTVNNNIVRDCMYGIVENGSASGITYRNNWVLDCVTNINADVDANDANTTVIDVDPGMVDYRIDGTGDYHLAGTSTASTTGVLLASPAEDFDRIGRLRPLPGIGAFRTIVADAPATSSALPTKVVGQYWPQWENKYPTEIPSTTNTLLLAFAVSAAANDGTVYWDGMYNPPAPNAGAPTLVQSVFEDDVQTFREGGRCAILSVGGSAGGLFTLDSTTKVTNFVNSIKALYNAWGGFDGIDWDIEEQATPDVYYVAASRELKDFYGGDFAISMSYAGNDSGPGSVTTFKSIAQALESTGDLDLASIQYYDYSPGPQTSDVTSRLNEMVTTYGVDPSHLGVGVKIVPGDPITWQTPAAVVSMWNTVEAIYPTLRGCNHWESITDRANGYGFSNTVGAAITS